jgi:hypothetical protein
MKVSFDKGIALLPRATSFSGDQIPILEMGKVVR